MAGEGRRTSAVEASLEAGRGHGPRSCARRRPILASHRANSAAQIGWLRYATEATAIGRRSAPGCDRTGVMHHGQRGGANPGARRRTKARASCRGRGQCWRSRSIHAARLRMAIRMVGRDQSAGAPHVFRYREERARRHAGGGRASAWRDGGGWNGDAPRAGRIETIVEWRRVRWPVSEHRWAPGARQ